MQHASFLVLSALAASGPAHGYGIVRIVEQLTGGRQGLALGTVYGVLDRLLSEGAVEVAFETVESGRLRRSYRVTRSGREALAGEVRRLEAHARLGRRVLGPSFREQV